MRRRPMLLLLMTVLAIVGTSIISPAAPSSTMTLSSKHDTAHALSWSGTVEAPALPVEHDSVPKGQDSRNFKVAIGDAKKALVTTYVVWDQVQDLDATVTQGSTQVDSSGSMPGEYEIMTYEVENGKTYTLNVIGSVNADTTYNAYTWVRHVSGKNFSGPNKLRYAKKDVLAVIDVPINIVFAGFDAAEVAAHKQRVLDQLPPYFRPAIRIGANFGGIGVTRREPGHQQQKQFDDVSPINFGAEGSSVQFEPALYRYKPRIITASEAWTKKMYAAAKAATTSGDYELPFDRDYLERYNRRAGALRGADGQVLPNEKIDFIDGFKLEDWVAKNPPVKDMTFDLKKPANGYTYFVMDSFRPSYAGQYFNKSRFHNFRIMNEITTDPDSGMQNGVDWARVWGGRYRFLMLDAGAAPNSWEADAALANARNFRVAGNGDSAKADPPIWHYRAEVPEPATLGVGTAAVDPLSKFYERIGENVTSAIWMRFTRGYLYRPRAYEKFILAGNTWHDADAYTPWPSRLDKLYKDKFVVQKYKELIPYAAWTGFSNYKYLTKTDPEQVALDEGKNRSDSTGTVAPAGVNPYPMMHFVNRNRQKYAPLQPGAFTIPVINVVFPSLYTWAAIPAVTGGVAIGEDGEPWGQIQNVNNRTKTYTATGTVKDSAGNTHEPAAPDVRGTANETIPGGVDNMGRFGFTSVALHEAGHFLGLSHTHDAVFYNWKLSEAAKNPSNPQGYYNTIDWMYTTTASPMGYGWEYNRFEVLDKDNIFIGHALEWLNEAQEGLVASYAALDAKRMTRLTPQVASLKANVEKLMNASVTALKTGRYLDAVKLALAAKKASLGTYASAARTAIGGKISRALTQDGTSGGSQKPSVNGKAVAASTMPEHQDARSLSLLAVVALAAVVTLHVSRRRPKTAVVRIVPPKHRG